MNESKNSSEKIISYVENHAILLLLAYFLFGLIVVLIKADFFNFIFSEPTMKIVKKVVHYSFLLVSVLGGALTLYFVARRSITDSRTLDNNSVTLSNTLKNSIRDTFDTAISNLGDKDSMAVRMGGVYSLIDIIKKANSSNDKEKELYQDYGKKSYDLLIFHLKHLINEDKVTGENGEPVDRYTKYMNNVFTELNKDLETLIEKDDGFYQTLLFEDDTEIEKEFQLAKQKVTPNNLWVFRKLQSNVNNKYYELMKYAINFEIQEVCKLIFANEEIAQFAGKIYNTIEQKDEGDEPLYPDLSNINLAKIKLEHAYMPFTNFKKANLEKVELSYSQLQFSSFVSTNLKRAYFQNVNLEYAKMPYCSLQGASLGNSNLQHVDFEFAKMQDCWLANSDMAYANLNNADLRYSILGSSLEHATLLHTKLHGASLSGTKMDYATVDINILSNETFIKSEYEVIKFRVITKQPRFRFVELEVNKCETYKIVSIKNGNINVREDLQKIVDYYKDNGYKITKDINPNYIEYHKKYF